MKHYVYKHLRKDNLEIFYIGLGTKNKKDIKYGTYSRAYSRGNRNNYWKNVVNKYGFVFEIIEEFEDYEKAKLKEAELIKFYGRQDNNSGQLVNMTDGGDGVLNLVVTSDARKKISEKSKGNKYWLNKNHSQISKERMRESRRLYLNTEEGQNSMEKLALLNKGNTYTKGKRHKPESNLKNKIAHQKKCVQKTLDGAIVKIFDEINETEKRGFNADSVIACCKGRKATYKNHKWEYLN